MMDRIRAAATLARAALTAATVAAAVLTAGCSGSTTGPGSSSVPVGLVVTSAGSTLITVHGTTADDGFRVGVGDTTAVFEVTFTDRQGEPLTLSGTFMAGEVESTVVATLEPTSPGAFSARIAGRMVGATRVRFKLESGQIGTGSEVYTSPWITVTVE